MMSDDKERLPKALAMRKKYREEKSKLITRDYELDCILMDLDSRIKEVEKKVKDEQ